MPTLTQGEVNTAFDFGFVTATGYIGNAVWLDEDGDGVRDAGEAGVANVLVSLTLENGTTVTTLTDRNGEYVFANVPAGNHTVTLSAAAVAAAGLVSTFDEDSGTTGVDLSIAVELDFGERHLTADFGLNWDDVATAPATQTIA